MWLKNVLNYMDKVRRAERAYAHCDVPCGIYDPHAMQLAAHTVLRMVDLINSLESDGSTSDIEKEHKLIRYTKVKEEHAEMCKHELRVLWGDYFKPHHTEQFPQLNDLVWDTLRIASKSRQNIDRQTAVELVNKTNEIAKIFWRTKGKETKEVVIYPTNEPIVIPT